MAIPFVDTSYKHQQVRFDVLTILCGHTKVKQRFQSMLFPEGIWSNPENGQFGTNKISQLYGLVRGEQIFSLKHDSNSNVNGGAYRIRTDDLFHAMEAR
jgi:hypothetical protein